MPHDQPNQRLVILHRRFVDEGDEDAFRVLVDELTPWLFCVVRRRMREYHRLVEASTDVVQKTLERLVRRGPRVTLDNDQAMRGYVATIVCNLLSDTADYAFAECRDVGRTQALPAADDPVTWVPGVVASVDQPDRVVERSEDVERVRAALLLMKPDDARVLRLRHWEGLDFAECGNRLGSSSVAARMRFHRAIDRLGRILEHLESGSIDMLIEEDGELFDGSESE